MPKVPEDFQASLELMGALPAPVVAAMVGETSFNTARAIRNLLKDLAAVIVLRAGPLQLTEASSRLEELANLFRSYGEGHAAEIRKQWDSFQEKSTKTQDGLLSTNEAIEQVAEAEALAKLWLASIADKSKGEQA